MSDVRVKVYRWDETRARTRPPAPLDVEYDGRIELLDPASGPDQERKAVQRAVGLRFGRRIRGCSSLVGGGYSVNIDPVKLYP